MSFLPWPGRAPALALAMAFALFSTALATTVVHLDTRELTLDSNDIVIGSVESVRSYWNPAHTRIFTDVQVNVSRSLKGDGARQLTLKL